MKEIKLQNQKNIFISVAIFCSFILWGCFENKSENSQNIIKSSIKESSEESLSIASISTPEDIEAKEQVPIHPWHTERVTNIRSESIQQLVENIANFDDYLFAITSNGSGYFRGEMESETGFVINLFRVRRLFEEGINNPEQVIPILQRAYNEIHKSWLDSREEDRQRMLKSNGDILSIALKEPDLFMKNTTTAVAMTYLLAELQDHDSLPILLEGYQKHRNWIEEYGEGKKVAPVPTPMTLYAIHRLAVTLPENKMDSQTLAARSAYLEWADKYVPEPKIFKVTAWNADYDESDPYRRIADPKGKVLKGQPSIYMVRYPYKLKDGTFFFDGRMEKEQKKEKEWADLLIPFVEAAIK